MDICVIWDRVVWSVVRNHKSEDEWEGSFPEQQEAKRAELKACMATEQRSAQEGKGDLVTKIQANRTKLLDCIIKINAERCFHCSHEHASHWISTNLGLKAYLKFCWDKLRDCQYK